jgi:hypothetical protein
MNSLRVLSAKQVADYLTERDNKPLSKRQVLREIKNGHIQGELIDGRYLVKESALKNYERRTQGVQRRKR